MKNTSTNILVIALMLVIIIGFYITLDELNKTREQLSNINMNNNNAVTGPSSESDDLNTRSINVGQESDVSSVPEGADNISTAILFNATSSPILTPQTKLTIIVDNLVKMEDNRIILNLKTYTNNAESYSALKPDNLFELINFSGENQKPLQVKGSFDSIPPQSVATGQVIFKLNQDRNEVILRVQTQEGDKHYRFNFDEQSYEEAILG